MRKHLIQTLLVLMATPWLSIICRGAQQPDSRPTPGYAPTGTVTGTIYASDTNAPIRFGQLTLVPINGLGKFSPELISGIDLEGRFVFRRVPEGKYYVSANVAGYLNPLSGTTVFHLDSMSLDEKKELKKRLNEVDVNADGATNLAIRLDRAGEIDGAVLFDDGSPASGLSLKIAADSRERGRRAKDAEHDSYWSYLNAYSPATDDRGQFRIIGLMPGSYLLNASLGTLQAEHQGEYLLAGEQDGDAFGRLAVFYGNAFRSKDAKVIHVREGEIVTGVDITIPLSKLNKVSGSVALRSNGQPPPAALVRVLYADTMEEARGIFAVDGAFQIAYLPEGSYVFEAEILLRSIPEGDDTVQFLRSGEKLFPETGTAKVGRLPVSITGDLSGVILTVSDTPPARTPPTD